MKSRPLYLVYLGAAAAAAMLLGGLLAPGTGSSQASVTPASYPSCGLYWNRNKPVSPAERKANACIVKASRAGRRARLVAALTTVEGDPIVNYVYVRGDRNILLVVDSRRDAFGPRAWTRFRCTGVAVVDDRLAWMRCDAGRSGKPPWLKPVRLRG